MLMKKNNKTIKTKMNLNSFLHLVDDIHSSLQVDYGESLYASNCDEDHDVIFEIDENGHINIFLEICVQKRENIKIY